MQANMDFALLDLYEYFIRLEILLCSWCETLRIILKSILNIKTYHISETYRKVELINYVENILLEFFETADYLRYMFIVSFV